MKSRIIVKTIKQESDKLEENCACVDRQLYILALNILVKTIVSQNYGTNVVTNESVEDTIEKSVEDGIARRLES